MSRPPGNPWYLEPAIIDRWVCGVFEGGGAKGVAFSGALLAMRDLRCWFSAVAGASAGAITAALVAAGLTPEEIDAQTETALSRVRTGVWKGIGRLQNEAGYFPSDSLADWLEALLVERVARAGLPKHKGRVTFELLHAATGIELNIVAADLSLRRQIVFSHHDTKKCSVADAVAASAAIPFAFPSRLLAVPHPNARPEGEQEKKLAHHTIVDGGVWSNFPMFIFEDWAFRERYEREPRVIDTEYIVGFLLDEGGTAPPTRGDDIMFASQHAVAGIEPYELLPAEFQRASSEPTAEAAEAPPEPAKPARGAHIAAAMLWPFALLGRAVELNGKIERGRWPRPETALVRYLVHGFNGLFSGMYPQLFGLLVIFMVGLGAWQISSYLVQEQLRVWPVTDWTEPMSWFARPLLAALVLSAVSLGTLATFATALGVMANRLLLRASRRVLYGLASTYVAGSGAPEWATLRRNIVALPIPPSVGTLSFDLHPDLRKKVIENARTETHKKVSALIGGKVAALT